ncbi:MAG: bifunctional ADP-dependent NAD(P)H-hydrate dehydratase/NAD(P)H-hydrate epimerase [Burkholderiales bacterium]|jgi:hydroxyethylthiazole kinase-like uncharacterized protein yjeF|nr:bifunctional ADP-dependent NAD(P)H-hydrate dehydratase/NAD(P)H-hydrate epimerase [Burkholderiales bacterium]
MNNLSININKAKFLTLEEHRQIELDAQRQGLDLMDLAAQAITDYVAQLPSLKQKNVLILVGKGNNGGDGVCCAIKLQKLGYNITVLTVFNKLSQHTTMLIERYKQLNGKIITKLPSDLSTFEIIIDAVIGIGISSELDSNTREIFEKTNSANVFVLAVDTPSGVNPFTGKVYPGSIKANLTLTFIADKPGLYNKNAANYVGDVILYPLTDLKTPSL